MRLPVRTMDENEYLDTGVHTADGFGALETASGNLPLDSLDLAIQTTGLAGDVQLSQGFRNPYPDPLEATYIFPLPGRAAVTAMRMEADDRTVEGVLKERGAARAEYERAVAGGQRAAIAEEERPDVFTMRVGNILPGERVVVRLRLALELGYEDGVASLRFPLVVAPRYIPGAPLPGGAVGTGVVPDTDAVPDASRITPPVLLPGCPNPVNLSISADVDPAGLPLSSVASSLHPVQVKKGTDGRTRVEVHPGERADRDFVLRLHFASEDVVTTSLSVVPDDEGAEGSFALTMLPPTETAPPAPRDVTLVLDRSGSMTGWKMVAARRAAARIVDALTSRDRFAVLAFDNTVETPPGLPMGLVEASDRHRYRAVEFLARLDARGGTEMSGPLRQAAKLLAGSVDEARERTLVLVTDGQIGNEDQILRELADQVSDLRIHAVGVDVAVNAGFLSRLTAVGGGRCELVDSEDSLDDAMEVIHRRIGTPLVTDLKFGSDGMEIVAGSVTPARLPAIYVGAPLVVRGRCRVDPGSPPAGGVSVRGRLAGGAYWRQDVPASLGSSPALATVWARAHIRDLEDRYVTVRLGSRSGIDQLERDVVATSLRFGVLSRFTAYVAVDSRVVRDGEELRRVTQPVETPQGWEMFGPAVPAVPVAGVKWEATSLASAGPLHASAGVRERGIAAARPTRASLRVSRPAALRHGAESQSPPADFGEAPPPLAESAELREVRRAMSEWAMRLREASASDRERLLDELADQLPALIDILDRAGVQELVVRPLRELLATLRAPMGIGGMRLSEIESRLTRALDVTEAFADVAQGPWTGTGRPGIGPPPAAAPRARPGTFWKR